MANSLFIDPTNLSTPSSPSGSSCTHDYIDPTHSAGPARKRVRSQDMSTEERKEARAHRNRIAAKNSRDRRKAQFTCLERRVAELEEENRRLRADACIRPAEPTYARKEARVGAESDRTRERENEELKERIRTLERGWDVVLKALAAQGLPNGLSSAPTSTSTTGVHEPKITKPSSSTVEPPLPNSTGIASFPSPAPSHSSLETLRAESKPPTLPGAMLSVDVPSGTGTEEESKHGSRETTRHLARVASIEGPSLAFSVALQRVVSLSAPTLPCQPISGLPYMRLPLKRVPIHPSLHLMSVSRTTPSRAAEMMTLWRLSSEKLTCHFAPPRMRRRKAAKYLLWVRSRRKGWAILVLDGICNCG